jgi:hypothetical protein
VEKHRRPIWGKAPLRSRFCQILSLHRLLTALVAFSLPSIPAQAEVAHTRHTRDYFRHEMALAVRADHPAILPVANAIRAVSLRPLEQLVMVNDVTHLLVDYDDDERIYGADEFHATFDEMIARRRESGWLYLRDDCDGRAVFAAHLLAALGIEWRLEASFWKEHAWVIARVGGTEYDLLDLRTNAPETDRLAYKLVGHFFVRPSRRPPPFAWRRAWAERTGQDLTLGLRLGLLALDSAPGRLHPRYATDWSVIAPGAKASPPDTRTRGAPIAGFPFGEPLHAVVAVPKPMPPSSTSMTVLSGATNSRTSDQPAAP